MKTADIEVGLRVYNRGDMANLPHWGTVTRIIKSARFSDQVEIMPELGCLDHEECEPYSVTVSMLSEVDKGNGSTRIVTETAYREFRQEQIQRFQAMASA